jgi:predicted transcriptional regulator
VAARPQWLTGDESARMNERIKELRGQGISGPGLPAILNPEFGVELPPAAYRARVAHLRLTWKGARATGEESAQMMARLKELAAEGVCARDIATTLNREFQRSLSPFAYYARARKLGLKLRRGHPRASSRRECVPQEQRHACLQDPAWEARKNISDRTACRECFRLYRGPVTLHLKAQHGMSLTKYRQLHPEARLFSFKQVAADTGRRCQDLMHEFAESHATPEERAAAALAGREYYRRNAITDHVICCVECCGFKSTQLHHHLRNSHGMSTRDYGTKYGWLPVTPEAILAKARANDKAKNEELKHLRAMTSLPQDWYQKPIEWRIVGNELLSRDYMSNVELGRGLDDSRLLTCPYGESWEKALSSNKRDLNRTAIKLVSAVRKWIGKPGKTPTPANSVK